MKTVFCNFQRRVTAGHCAKVFFVDAVLLNHESIWLFKKPQILKKWGKAFL